MSDVKAANLLKSLLASMGLEHAFAFEGNTLPGSAYGDYFSQIQRPIWEQLIEDQRYLRNQERQNYFYALLGEAQARFKLKPIEGTSYCELIGSVPAVIDAGAVNAYFNGKADDALGFLAAIVGDPSPSSDWRLASLSSSLKYRLELDDGSRFKSEISKAIAFSTRISEDFDDQKKIIKREFDNLFSVYSNKLKLSKSENYFKEKARSHFRAAIASALILFVLLSVAVLTIFIYVYPRIDSLAKEATQNGVYLYGAMIAAVGFFYGWIARVFSRVFQINMNLWSDAKQRAVLISVFLSLQNEGGVQSDEKERILILNALFRPLDSKEEDVAQPTILDLLQKPKN